MITIIGNKMYQWDTGRVIACTAPDGMRIDEIHIDNNTGKQAIVLEVYMDAERVCANIPDVVLQTSKPLNVYAVMRVGDEENTIEHEKFQVIARKKPDDYVYEEEELRTYKKLEAKIEELEEKTENFEPGGGGTAEVTAESIAEALGYVPADDAKVNELSEQIGEQYEKTIHYIESISFPVGENLINDSIPFVLGANWTGDIASGFTHASGSKEPLIIQVPTDTDVAYYIDWETVENYEAALLVSIGNTVGVDTYKGSEMPSTAIISDGGYLKFTPESNYAGSISNISIRKVGEGETIITKEVFNIDSNTMENSIVGFWNTAIGRNVLKCNQNGSRNVGVGNNALRELTTGTRNIGIGTFALCYLQSGERNIAIGADSLWFATHADDCIAIGMAAMSTRGTAETSLKECIAIGRDAMHNCANDARNVIAVGRYAGTYATIEDVFVGTRAGYRSGGRGNTAIGDQAFSTYTQSGDGARDPETGNLMGDYNTFIGKNADVADVQTAKNRSTAIGYNAKVEKDDQVVIGGDNVLETLAKGDFIVRGTDGIKRRLVFNPETQVPVGDAQLFNYRDAEYSSQLPNSSLVTVNNNNTRTWIIPRDGVSGERITFNTFTDKTASELGISALYIYFTNEKPDTAGLTVLQTGVTSIENKRGSMTVTQAFKYIAVSFQLSTSLTDEEKEATWNEVAQRLTVQVGAYATQYTDYYTSQAGTVTWEYVSD